MRPTGTRRRWGTVALLVAAGCGDPVPPPAEPPRQAPVAPADRPARATAPRTDVVPIDGSPWTPSDDDVAAARGFADPDTWDQDFADERAFAAAIRAGLRSPDPVVARVAAFRAKHQWLDEAEQRRAAALFADAVLDAKFTLPDGSSPTFRGFVELAGDEDLTRILQRIVDEKTPHDRVMGFGYDLHQVLRPSHVPLLADVAKGASEDGAVADAWEMAVTALTWSDDHPDAIAAVAAQRLARQGVEGTFPLPTRDPIAAAAMQLRHHDLLATENDLGRRAAFWAWRLLGRTERASAAQAPALLEIARILVDGPEMWGDEIGRLADSLPSPLAEQLLRALDDLADGPPKSMTLAALAKRGDAEARERLLLRVDQGVPDAIAAALWALPKDAFAHVSRIALAEDEEAATTVLAGLREADESSAPALWDRAQFGEFARIAAKSASPERLALLAAHLPIAPSRALGEAILARADEPLAADDTLFAFLETVDADALRRRLRAWAFDGVDVASEDHARTLLFLGDPPQGPRLVRWLRSLVKADRDWRFPIAAARSDSPEVRTFLAEMARDGDAWNPWRTADGIAALAVCHGLPEATALSLGDALEDASADVARRARDAVSAGRPADAVCAVLAARPDERFDDVHLIGARPEVIAYLDRIRERRELGHYAWATAELGLLGREDALHETTTALREHRYGWLKSLTWRHLTFGKDAVDAAPWWIEELESNCCASIDLDGFFEPVLGWSVGDLGSGLVVRADDARRRWARAGGRFAWSRIAGHFVPAPR